MEEDIRLFLNYLSKEKKCSKNTLDAYHNDLSQLADYITSPAEKENPVHGTGKLNEESLSAYMLNLKDKGYAVSTVARKIAAARTFLKFMCDRGKIQKDLAPKLSAPKVNKLRPKALSVSEVRRLLDETTRSPAVDARRDRAMLELLYASGLLASELMSLNIDDVNLYNGTITVTNQRGKSRVVPLDKRVNGIIKEYMETTRIKLLVNDKEKALFLNQRGERLTRQGFWQIVQGYADVAGLPVKVTPRIIRHSFAMHKLNSGADLQSIQEVLGHAHISTTRAYKQA